MYKFNPFRGLTRSFEVTPPDDSKPSEEKENDNNEYDTFVSSVIDASAPAMKYLPPEDYRFIDENTYRFTHPEKWYGYRQGKKIDGRWYWQRPDGMWINEDNEEVGHDIGITGGKSTKLSSDCSNKNIMQYMSRIPNFLFNLPIFGPMIKQI